MKKVALFVVVVMAVSFIVYGCKKKAAAPAEEVVVEKQAEVKGVQSTEQSAAIAKALCSKFAECDPSQKDALDPCVSETAVGIEGLFKAKGITITKDQVETCIAAIGKGTCQEIIDSVEPPAGCEFLK